MPSPSPSPPHVSSVKWKCRPIKNRQPGADHCHTYANVDTGKYHTSRGGGGGEGGGGWGGGGGGKKLDGERKGANRIKKKLPVWLEGWKCGSSNWNWMLLQSGVGRCLEKLCRNPKWGWVGVGGGARDDRLKMHAAAKSGQKVISSAFVRRHRWATHTRPDLLFNYLFISLQLSLMFQSAEWFSAR